MPFALVGGKGLEPSTPALSKQCSKPTELTTQRKYEIRSEKYEVEKYSCQTPRRFISFLISNNSRPVWPPTLLFSCARRMR